MLFILIFLTVLVACAVAWGSRDAVSRYLLAMSMANCLMLAGIMVYIAQCGGLPASQNALYFLTRQIRNYLRVLPIHMDKLGYAVALGRTLFPMLALQTALISSNNAWIRRNEKLLIRIAWVPTALLLLYYFPKVFRAVTQYRFRLMLGMMNLSLIYIIVYLVLTMILLISEQYATTISFYRKKTANLSFTILGSSLLYLIYASKDPTQIYNYYISEYIRNGISSYIGPTLSTSGWTVVGTASLCFVLLGSYGMLRYTRMVYNEERQDLTLQRRFDVANSDIAVFAHSIKNQLLTSRVLMKRMDRILRSDEPDIQALSELLEQLRVLNDSMQCRISEINTSVRNNALVLTPYTLEEVVREAITRFRTRYSDIEVKMDGSLDHRVLADLSHLAEALYNLLINGYEAALNQGRIPELSVTASKERLWIVLEIRDNGGGIPALSRRKIFKPFYSEKDIDKSWGMGLFYTQRIIRNHFGKLRLESRDGTGSSFYVMLPRYDTRR